MGLRGGTPPRLQVLLRGGRAAHAGLSCPTEQSAACQGSILPPGVPASSPFWAQHEQICGDKPTEQPVGELGAEPARRNERPADGGAGSGEAASSQASLFSSPTGSGHGPASGRSPSTGALTPGSPPPRGPQRASTKAGCRRVRGVGGCTGLREGLERWGPAEAAGTRGQPCPPGPRGLQGLAVKTQVTSSS